MKMLLFLLFVLGSSNLFAIDSWYQQKRRGWYYFEESSKMVDEQKNPDQLPRISPERAVEMIEEEKEKTHKFLCLALVQPSHENVALYLKQQKKMIDQSARFASSWKGSFISNPELGYSLPQSDYANRVSKMKEEQDRSNRLKEVKKEHFLVFLFNGNEFESKEAAEVVLRLSKLGEWRVEALSMDGVGVKEFPQFTLDQGFARRANIKRTPALYLVQPTENYIIPVASGLIDYESIEKNIDFQIQRKGDSYHAL